MNRFPKLRPNMLVLVALTAIAALAIACGSAGDESPNTTSSNRGFQPEQGGGDGDSEEAAEFSDLAVGQSTSNLNSGAEFDIAPPAPVAFPTATPAAMRAEPQGPTVGSDRQRVADSGNPSPPELPLSQQQPQIGNERIIIRNVDMSIEVNDTAGAIEQISTIAGQEGGWVVRTQNVEVHRGAVDIRVPASRLEAVLTSIRNLASNVVSEVSTSQDFTEEFTDTTARIRTLQDTVDALRALFARAEEVEDALTIQREITRIQSEIEVMQARINFLSQSSAFSLIRLAVLALPQTMEINAGEDKLAAVSRSVRFRAEFTPPEGIENFLIEWDFGDGTGRQVVTGVAPVNTEGRVISAPVVHTYHDDTDSPYIVKVNVTGTGESGAAEGEDVMVVTVNRVPPIEVFVGDNRVVDAGEEVTFEGSFTRPDGVDSLTYTWDFGDGSAPVTVDADPESTKAEITHTYANSRPRSYEVVLTVQGETAAGSTEGTDRLSVVVEEPEGLTSSGFTPGESGRSAFRMLSSIGTGLATAAIWIGVLSPIWIIAGVGFYVYYRNHQRNVTRRTAERLASAARSESSES